MDPKSFPRFASGEKSSPEQWTNEKHVRFLNSMESWFVRTMMEDTDRSFRLDRHLPDSEESTLDSKLLLKREGKHAILVNFVGTRSRVIKRLRRPSPHPYISSQDQVVPQAENRRGDASRAAAN